MKFLISSFIVLFINLLTFGQDSGGQAKFHNPLEIDQMKGCQAENLVKERFSQEIDPERRIRICEAVNSVVERLNQGKWSDQLESELLEVWEIFCREHVFFASLGKDKPGNMLGLAQAFPDSKSGFIFEASISIKDGVEKKKWFYQVLLHEARHVDDFYCLWKEGKMLPSSELERRAFRMMSMFDQETPKDLRYSKLPQLWKDKWSNLAPDQMEFNRDAAIANFLRKSSYYRNITQNEPFVQPPSKNQTYAEISLDPPKLVRRSLIAKTME